MKRNIHTDLAIEAREMYSEDKEVEIPGVKVDREEEKDYTITRVEIINQEGKEIMGKEIGLYTTIESKLLKHDDDETKELISNLIQNELNHIFGEDKKTALIIGLGNWNITSDALGPKVISKIMVTRHLFEMYKKENDEDEYRNVSALSPGVMGLTGIETSEIVKSVSDTIKPDLIIAVDALASRKLDRVNSTIQISTAGISPGAGIGNIRKALNEEFLNVPVVAIGVPTVVDAATLSVDVIDMTIDNLINSSDKGKEFYNMLKELQEEEKYSLIKDVLDPFEQNVIVTPKDIDEIIDNLAVIISDGLNKFLHPCIKFN